MGNEFKSISSQDGSCSVNVGEYAGDYKIEFKVGGINRGTINDQGLFEIDNIACRGLFRTTAFETDTISVVGGSVLVRPGDTLAYDMTALDSSELVINGNDTFAVGDILRIKDGVDDEFLEVTNAVAAPIYEVIRDKAGLYSADDNPVWAKGAAVVNYGVSGKGGLLLTSSIVHAPYMSVFTHTGDPWTSVDEKVRVGNLNGYLGYGSDVYGVGIGSITSGEANLTFDPTNGIRLRQGTTDLFTIDMDNYALLQEIVLTGLKDGSNINGGYIEDATITADQIDNATIIGGNIALATITGDNIDSATISGGNIALATITGDNIDGATITGYNIDSATITGDNIDSATITGGNIDSATIAGGNIALGTIVSANIEGATITGGDIALATITGGNIDSSTITGGNIDSSTITGGNIDSSTITGGNIEDQAVTAGKIENLTITASQIANLTITGGSGGKIATSTISEDNIVGNTITALSIHSDAITTDELAANSVTADHIVVNSITSAEINTADAFIGMTIQSTAFSAGVTGWQINNNGNVEFNGGTFRGTVTWTGESISTDYTDADTTDYTNSDVANALEENDVLTITRPLGASRSLGSSSTGVIKISLPQSWTSTMMKFVVDIFEYTDGLSFSLALSGYNYISGSTWVNCTANLTGSTAANNRVRFGHDGTRCCICIGETTSNWAYLKAFVRDFQAGHANYAKSQWDDGWGISVISSLSGITFTKDISDSLIDAQSIVGQGDLAVENDLDGVPNGAQYGRVYNTAISNGKIVLTSAGVTGTLPTSLTIAKCTDANADQTSTHTANNASHYTGADISTNYTDAKCQDANADETCSNTAWDAAHYTGSNIGTNYTSAKCQDATADKTSTHNCANPGDYTSSHGQNLGWLIGSTGTLTISSAGKLSINTSNALEITANGNMKVLAGGDINMYGSTTNPSKINFYDCTSTLISSISSPVAGGLHISPSNWGGDLFIGTAVLKWADIVMHSTRTEIFGYNTSTDYAMIAFQGTHTDASYLRFKLYGNGSSKSIYFYKTQVYPSLHKVLNLGTSSTAWNDAYADDWHNVADFYNFDIHDDLAAINGIKGSGILQEHSGHELIDDDTLPAWLISKHKEDGEVRNEENDKILNTYKKGDVMHDSDGKPYLSLKACISLAWGAIRQLDKKIEAINENIIN